MLEHTLKISPTFEAFGPFLGVFFKINKQHLYSSKVTVY